MKARKIFMQAWIARQALKEQLPKTMFQEQATKLLLLITDLKNTKV